VQDRRDVDNGFVKLYAELDGVAGRDTENGPVWP
jgi:hypothetical protein